MSEEKKKRNKIIGISIGILVVLLVVISSTYAYWQITKSQNGSNDIIAACLDIDMESVDGTFGLNPAWPISDSEGMNLTGYKFKVTNKCEEDVNYVIGMDSLEVSGSTYLSYDSIKVSMDNAPAMIYGEQEDIDHIEAEDTYTIRDSKKIATSVVKNGQPNEHIVKVWIKSDAPVEEQSRVFSGRMFITGGQNIENDKPLAKLIATGDMSRTENDNVKYRFYDNGDLIISGTGEIKDYDMDEFFVTLFNQYFDHYNIALNEEEQAITSDSTLFGYLGLIWYGKPYYIEHMTSGSFTNKDDVLNYVKNNTQYGDAYESILEKTSKFKFKNVVIEDGVTSIGRYGLSSILADNIYIADSVTELKGSALCGTSADNLRLSENLKTIESSAFSSLNLASKTLFLPESVENIFTDIIRKSNIEIIKLPNNANLNSIEAFYNQNNLKTVIIPEKISKIPSFYNSSSITLKLYGSERTIYNEYGTMEADLTQFKEVIWNYTEE